MREVAQVYKELNFDFEPRWFPVVQLLMNNGQLSIKQIADKLEVTHSGISQIITGMKKVFIKE